MEEAISEVTTRLNTPFTLMLPPDSNSTGWQDEVRFCHWMNEQSEMKTKFSFLEKSKFNSRFKYTDAKTFGNDWSKEFEFCCFFLFDL